MMVSNLLSLQLLALLLNVAFCIANPDEIKYLPGLKGTASFKQYSGYLNATNGKFLHYWFVESQHSPSTDPVLLWMNGGPGCSSLDGFLSELGPFHVNADGKTLYVNEYSWNKMANVLFLEAPAGVGFSYSESQVYSTDDDIVAHDNYFALQHFFMKFPQFKGNDFYITGESYGGIYIPTLSVLVLDGPAKINFKGFAIGNGYLDAAKLSNSIVFFAYHHGLVDVTQWNDLTKYCCKGNVSREMCDFAATDVPQCMTRVETVANLIQNSGLNVYNLYADCATSSLRGFSRQVVDKRNLLKGFRFINSVGDSPPCIDGTAVTKYLNQKDVRTALHIPPTVQDWTVCSTEVEMGYKRIYNRMQPQVMKLLNSGRIRGLIYNGDVDMACNFLGDEWFVEDLGLQVLQDYRPWKFNNQIAGFVKTYRNLAFLTIKGSGHMVPGDKPGPAFKMITSFIFEKPY